MKITYLGYDVECSELESWDKKVKSNHLTIEKPRLPRDSGREPQVILEMWWPGKMKDGIKEGVKLVDKHIKAMTITPGKG